MKEVQNTFFMFQITKDSDFINITILPGRQSPFFKKNWGIYFKQRDFKFYPCHSWN